MAKRAETKTLFGEATAATKPEPEFTPPPKPRNEVAVAPRRPRAPAPATIEPAADAAMIWQSIERMATNKDVDAEKLDKLLSLQERMLDRGARTAFDTAMIAMQPKLPVIEKDAAIIVREKDNRGARTGEITQNTPYAKWEKIVPLIKPVLARYGFSLTHRSSTAPSGKLRVTAILKGHGHTDDSCYLDLEADGTGSKNNAQAWASALSYAKRHTACAVLNIVTREASAEDDDGKASGAPLVKGDALNVEQAQTVLDLCEAVRCSHQHFLKHMNATRPRSHPEITAVGFIPQSRFDEAIAALNGYESTKRARAAETMKGGKDANAQG